MTEPSLELVQQCKSLGSRLNVAVVGFQMLPVNVDFDPSSDSEARNLALMARYAEMETAAKLDWQNLFGEELSSICDALAQLGTAPPLPPMDWDAQSMREIATILATIEL